MQTLVNLLPASVPFLCIFQDAAVAPRRRFAAELQDIRALPFEFRVVLIAEVVVVVVVEFLWRMRKGFGY